MRTSCIIINYNYGHYVLDAVNSVLSQSHPFDEIIIVDDGSTDDSLKKLHEAFSQRENIRILKKKNEGQLSSINYGFLNSSGDIVYFLDADDMYKESYLEETLNIYKNSDYDFIFCGYEKFGKGNEKVLNYNYDKDFGISLLSTLYLKIWVGGITSTISVKRSILKKILPIPYIDDWKTRADDCLVWGTSLAGARKLYLNKDLVLYRIHGDNQYYGRTFSEIYNYRRELYVNRLFSFFLSVLNYDVDRLPSALDEFKLLPAPSYEDLLIYLKVVNKKEKKFGKRLDYRIRMIRHYAKVSLKNRL